jgi:muramoyltetrapeptide carboxypeptidase
MKINVAAITPSWLIKKKKDFTDGIAGLEKLGFNVLNKQCVTKLPSPQDKAAQINAAFADPNVGLILAQRGGYSALKTLPFIDFKLIKKHPKVFAGFSDLTTLLNPIYEKCGIITLHSPMIVNFSPRRPKVVKSFMNAINGFPEKELFKGTNIKVYHPGRSCGILKGGNLITMTAMIKTPWETDVDGCILFIEDVDEKLHSIDRYLTQWILLGKLQKAAGIVLGTFNGVKTDDVYKIISVHCPNIGHVPNKITLPVGAKVSLDTVKKSLRILDLKGLPVL